MLYQPKPSEAICTGKFVCIWSAYALGMSWLWNGLTAAGFPAGCIWALAGLAGVMLLLATREI